MSVVSCHIEVSATGLITRPRSPTECDLETSKNRRRRADLACWATGKERKRYCLSQLASLRCDEVAERSPVAQSAVWQWAAVNTAIKL
jgi:hypothetical protein